MGDSGSLIGKTLSHYRILGKLGGGEMGVVTPTCCAGWDCRNGSDYDYWLDLRQPLAARGHPDAGASPDGAGRCGCEKEMNDRIGARKICDQVPISRITGQVLLG